MKKIEMDEVMKEIHAIKDANSARFDHDLKRLFAHWSKLGEKIRSKSSDRTSGAKRVLPSARRRIGVTKKTVMT